MTDEDSLKAYRFITGTRISPFGDSVSESQVGDTQLGLAVTQELEHAGLTPCPGDPGSLDSNCMVLSDRIFVARKTVEKFLDACPKTEDVFRLSLKKGPLTRWLCPLANVDEDEDRISLDCYIVRKDLPRTSDWNELRQVLAASARSVLLDPGTEVQSMYLPIPPGVRDHAVSVLPRTELVAADISHWIHLLWLNQLIPWLRLRQHRGKKTDSGSIIGKHCDIHPTALVENSIIGDGVSIGPFSSVIDCVLGDGVELSESSRLKSSCVGHDCRTLPDSYFIGCTFYPGSTIANFMLRESMVGRGCFITSGIVFNSTVITGPVHVDRNGRSMDTGRWMLGSAVGHGCTLGTLGPRGSVAPGMEIPNGYMIVMNPADGLKRPPREPKPLQAFINNAGTAIPFVPFR